MSVNADAIRRKKMKLLSNLVYHAFNRLQQKQSFDAQFKKIKSMRSNNSFAQLTEEQKQETQFFFKKYLGENVSLLWHEYYYYANGHFSAKYIPTYIYYKYIYPKLNDTKTASVYSDKNMIVKLLGNRVNLPKTYIRNINGVYYSDEQTIQKEDAIAMCQNIEDGIIKHSLDSMQGKSILRFSSKEGLVKGKDCPATIRELVDSYATNFVVQAAVQQCDEMASLNPTSLNTIRIMTYWSQHDGIVPIFEVVRMGRSGAVIDNASSGGLYCGVTSDGYLKKHAYTLYPYSKHTQSDSGIVFENFQIPMLNEIQEKAVELHEQLPYAKIIGWDFAIDTNHEIVLIEINARQPGIFQVATGPAFGKYTEEILELCFNKQNK